MATPAYKSISTAVANGSIVISPPGTYSAGDLFLLLVHTCNNPVSTPSGWTALASGNNGLSANTEFAVSLQVFFKVAGSSESNLSISNTGNTYGAWVSYSPAVTSSVTPVVTVDGGDVSPAVYTGITTAADNTLVVLCIAQDRDGNGSNIGSVTSSGVTFTERFDTTSSLGSGGGLGLLDGGKATAGATGDVSAVVSYRTVGALIALTEGGSLPLGNPRKKFNHMIVR